MGGRFRRASVLGTFMRDHFFAPAGSEVCALQRYLFIFLSSSFISYHSSFRVRLCGEHGQGYVT